MSSDARLILGGMSFIGFSLLGLAADEVHWRVAQPELKPAATAEPGQDGTQIVHVQIPNEGRRKAQEVTLEAYGPNDDWEPITATDQSVDSDQLVCGGFGRFLSYKGPQGTNHLGARCDDIGAGDTAYVMIQVPESAETVRVRYTSDGFLHEPKNSVVDVTISFDETT